MNPLKKALLGVLFGLAVGLYITQPNDKMAFFNSCVFIFYILGVLFGWRILLPWIGKFLKIGTDLTFWLLFVCLFRRGFMWGVIILLLIVSFTLGIGCWAGIIICFIEIGRYLFGKKDAWKKKCIFPYAEIDALCLITFWFLHYNKQSDTQDDDFSPLCNLYPKQEPNTDKIVESVTNGELPDLYRAILVFRELGAHPETENAALTLIQTFIHFIAKSGKLTYQAKEFLLLILENYTLTWTGFNANFTRLTGKPLPMPQDPTIISQTQTGHTHSSQAAEPGNATL